MAGDQTDASKDAGLLAPDYDDIRSVVIFDNGSSAQISVEFGADLPNPLPSNEVMGVGVDLFRDSSEKYSDYQVFADGEENGWFAYLQTPQGFTKYPGSFRIGGVVMIFELPWPALGDIKGTAFSAFADWSSTGLVNKSSQDHAPDSGKASFAR